MSGFELVADHPDPGSIMQRVSPRGDLDLHTAGDLAEHFDQLMKAGTTMIVLDAARLDFVDCSGLHAILIATKQLTERGGGLLIDNMSPALRRILELTHLLERYTTPH